MALPLLAVSGEEIVLALQRAGFQTVSRAHDVIVLTRGYRDVVVPLGPLKADMLLEILRTARIPYATFIELLERAVSASQRGTSASTSQREI